jgi:hypothetical protein
MTKKAIWISYDFGLNGDYTGLYTWLDNMKAIECGNSLAFINIELSKTTIDNKSTNKDILLFVRESSFDENGVTMGFVFCGKLQYIQHEGRKPMSITWSIETPPPALLLEEGKKLGVG